MKRNSIFNTIPLLRPKRNTFNLSYENKLSTDLFRLTPIMCKEALPDDVFKIRPEIFCRVSPMLSPIFHRLNIRTYYFFVPTRIIWKDFEQWINPKSGVSEIVPPKLTVENLSEAGTIYGNFAPKTLADYLGVNFGLNAQDQSNLIQFTIKMAEIFPTGFTISSLPFRAYQQIYNDWFIDLNNVDPAEFSKDSGVEVLGHALDPDADIALENALLKLRYRCWEHDYFTSALPEPQRGPDVNAFDGGSGSGGGGSVDPSDLIIGGRGTLAAPITEISDVVGSGKVIKVESTQGQNLIDPKQYVVENYSDFNFADAATAEAFVEAHPELVRLELPFFNNKVYLTDEAYQDAPMQALNGKIVCNNRQVPVNPHVQVDVNNNGDTEHPLGFAAIDMTNIASHLNISSINSNTRDDPETSIPAVTVEELRIRMQMQSFLERNEIGGPRYTEMLYAHWGVKDPDGRLQRSEFIGGCKQPIVINDISQTVNAEDEPLGMYGGQGTSSSVGKTIKYRVPEHGFIIGITCIVPRSGYSQGISPMWSRFDRLDYYWPSFAHLGEQEVKYKELMFTGINPEQTFGYQQRYAEYKSSFDEVHGDMKGGLAHWHMSRIFDTPTDADDMPKLSENFTTPQDSDSDALSRVWPVESTGFEVLNADHFVLDIYQHIFASRRMPKFATPRNGS